MVKPYHLLEYFSDDCVLLSTVKYILNFPAYYDDQSRDEKATPSSAPLQRANPRIELRDVPRRLVRAAWPILCPARIVMVQARVAPYAQHLHARAHLLRQPARLVVVVDALQEVGRRAAAPARLLSIRHSTGAGKGLGHRSHSA